MGRKISPKRKTFVSSIKARHSGHGRYSIFLLNTIKVLRLSCKVGRFT